MKSNLRPNIFITFILQIRKVKTNFTVDDTKRTVKSREAVEKTTTQRQNSNNYKRTKDLYEKYTDSSRRVSDCGQNILIWTCANTELFMDKYLTYLP